MTDPHFLEVLNTDKRTDTHASRAAHEYDRNSLDDDDDDDSGLHKSIEVFVL